MYITRQNLYAGITLILFLFGINGFHSYAQNDELVMLLEAVQDFVKSPIEDIFVIADANGSLYVWNATTQEKIVNLAGGIITARRNTLRWSLDGRLIAGSFEDAGRLWDARTGELLHEFNEHPVSLIDEAAVRYSSGVSDVAISPEGSLIATANLFDATVLLWDAHTYEIVSMLTGHEAGGYPVGVAQLEFNSNGSVLAALKAVGGVALWDVQTGRRITDLSGEVIRFSDDGTKLAAGLGRLSSEISIWDVQTGEHVDVFEAPLVATELEWALEDSVLVANFTEFRLVNDGFEYTSVAVRSWDLTSSQPLHTFGIFSENVIGIELASDEVVIGIGVVQSSGSFLIWNQASGEVYHRETEQDGVQTTIETTSQNMLDFQLNPDETLIAANTSNQIMVWNFVTGERLHELIVEGTGVMKINWLNLGATMVLLSQDGRLSSWDVTSP